MQIDEIAIELRAGRLGLISLALKVEHRVVVLKREDGLALSQALKHVLCDQ